MVGITNYMNVGFRMVSDLAGRQASQMQLAAQWQVGRTGGAGRGVCGWQGFNANFASVMARCGLDQHALLVSLFYRDPQANRSVMVKGHVSLIIHPLSTNDCCDLSPAPTPHPRPTRM